MLPQHLYWVFLFLFSLLSLRTPSARRPVSAVTKAMAAKRGRMGMSLIVSDLQ